MEIEILDPYSFEVFWDVYDKKVERIKCERKWGRLSAGEKKLAIEYIPMYRQAQPNKQYRKNPDTFINNKSWNDELIHNKQQITDDSLANAWAEDIAKNTSNSAGV